MKNQIAVVEKGLAYMDEHDRPKDGFFYHNRYHGQQVVTWAGKFGAEVYGPNTFEHNALVRSAAWHDAVQGLGAFENEMESARLEAKCAQKHGFSLEETVYDAKLIMGTICTKENDITHQVAEIMDLPAKILADADLSALGMEEDDFIFHVQMIIAEMYQQIFWEMNPVDIKEGWQIQVQFMTGRRFLTEVANDLLGKKLQENLETAKIFADM